MWLDPSSNFFLFKSIHTRFVHCWPELVTLYNSKACLLELETDGALNFWSEAGSLHHNLGELLWLRMMNEVFEDLLWSLNHSLILSKGLIHQILQVLFDLWSLDGWWNPFFAEDLWVLDESVILDASFEEYDESIMHLFVFEHTFEVSQALLFDFFCGYNFNDRLFRGSDDPLFQRRIIIDFGARLHSLGFLVRHGALLHWVEAICCACEKQERHVEYLRVPTNMLSECFQISDYSIGRASSLRHGLNSKVRPCYEVMCE